MHGRTIVLSLASLLALTFAPSAAAQVPGLPQIFPPSQEEPEEPQPKPQEPKPEEPKPDSGPPPQQQQQQPRPQPQPAPQPQPQPEPGAPVPPAPVILTITPRDLFLGRSVEIVGRARPNVPVSLVVREPWSLDIPLQPVTATSDANGIYKLRYRPSGNVTVQVADRQSLSKPAEVFVVPRMQIAWTQKRGRVEALVYQDGTKLAGARGARIHFYGFAGKRSRLGRRLGAARLIVGETRSGATVVGAYVRTRHARRLAAIGYCAEWGERFERPSWQQGCGDRTLRF